DRFNPHDLRVSPAERPPSIRQHPSAHRSAQPFRGDPDALVPPRDFLILEFSHSTVFHFPEEMWEGMSICRKPIRAAPIRPLTPRPGGLPPWPRRQTKKAASSFGGLRSQARKNP